MISLLFGVGFYIGRKTVKIPKPDVEIVYEPGEPIIQEVPKPVPYKVVEPADTLNIIKECIANGVYSELWPKEVIHDVVPTVVDTNKIIQDWAARRYYSEELFDIDTLGRCVVNAEVQYNRIDSLSYEYTPKIKTIEKVVYKSKKYSPFVGVGASINPWNEVSNPMLELSGGMYYNDKYGLQLKYQKGLSISNDYIGASALFKF
jgi:hypothetical protein